MTNEELNTLRTSLQTTAELLDSTLEDIVESLAGEQIMLTSEEGREILNALSNYNEH